MPRWLRIVLAVIAAVSGAFVAGRTIRELMRMNTLGRLTLGNAVALVLPMLVLVGYIAVPLFGLGAIRREIKATRAELEGVLSPAQSITCEKCIKRIDSLITLLVFGAIFWFISVPIVAAVLLH